MPDTQTQQPTLTIHHGDNLPILRTLPSASVNLVYIDPPFNTGKAQSRTRTKTVRDKDGDRTGFAGERYRTTVLSSASYADTFDEYLAFLKLRIVECKRLLKDDGSFFLHLDWREVHYAKVLCDTIFGRESFLNEIIWAYDYGGRSNKRWPAKHNSILWYAVDPKNYTFNVDAVDRIPYMAPGLVTKEKAERGKRPTDVWWHTIVSPTGKEKTGYPTQKPRGVLDRIIKVHTNEGDTVLDCFAGSGTAGESALAHNRNAILIDESDEAIRVMRDRLKQWH